jgi:nicotinamide phosphoribosyltransferase
MLWKMSTSATTAYQFKQLLNKYADGTIGNRNFVSYQAHDFSFRGMSGIEDAAMSGAGHLTSFYGTDTVPAVDLLEDFYQGSVSDIIGISVPATEHSVMCAGSKDGEFETFKRLITEVYPSGPISIVSDTWDLWTVLNDYLPRLRSEILNRKGRIIIRPDSGDPVDISLKTVEILYKNFPGKTSKRGYERMHDNLGVIYGDGITLKRCEAILKGLKKRGLSSDNMVFGIGSYTYQYKTRDNLGWAVKSTAVCINGEWQPIQKDPVTDTGNKKSAKGFLKVINYDGFELVDNLYYNYKTEDDCLDIVFRNGSLVSETSLEKIRKRIND